MARINDASDERVGQGRRVDHWITSGVRNDRRSEIRMMFLMTARGIFKRDKSQRLVNHKGVDMCINVGWSARGVWREGGTETGRDGAHANVMLRCMNGTVLRRLPYRRLVSEDIYCPLNGYRHAVQHSIVKNCQRFRGRANPYSFRFRFFFKFRGEGGWNSMGSRRKYTMSFVYICMTFRKIFVQSDHMYIRIIGTMNKIIIILGIILFISQCKLFIDNIGSSNCKRMANV